MRASSTDLAKLTPIQITRRAETKRFGAPVNVLFAWGLLGAGFVIHWMSKHKAERWDPPIPALVGPLPAASPVTKQAEVEALLDEVRDVLARFGISLGEVPLKVRLNLDHGLEGLTVKVRRPPPTLRGIEAVSIRPGLSAISTAQVLAHEYTHCWLWLQGFPPLDRRLEEGLCELLSYLYLLSRLREPPTTTAVLALDETALREQIASIEANAHPDYGGGFRDCVQALRGRELHQLLGHVRTHGCLPPPLPWQRLQDEAEDSTEKGQELRAEREP